MSSDGTLLASSSPKSTPPSAQLTGSAQSHDGNELHPGLDNELTVLVSMALIDVGAGWSKEELNFTVVPCITITFLLCMTDVSHRTETLFLCNGSFNGHGHLHETYSREVGPLLNTLVIYCSCRL